MDHSPLAFRPTTGCLAVALAAVRRVALAGGIAVAGLGGWAANPDPRAAEMPAPVAALAGTDELSRLQHLAPAEAAGVLGRLLRGQDGHEIGRIIDVLVDQAGRPRAAIIDFGGFMGVGTRKVAVDWRLLRFAPGEQGQSITLELTPDQIKAAPDYKPGATPAIVTSPPDATGSAPQAAASDAEKTVPDPKTDRAGKTGESGISEAKPGR